MAVSECPTGTVAGGRVCARERLGLSLDLPLVVYSGTFEAYQGLPDLLSAIPLVRAHVPNATFVLVGADRNGASIEHECAAALQETGALRIIERQPRSSMAPYLAMADVLVSPASTGTTFRSRSSITWRQGARLSPRTSRRIERCWPKTGRCWSVLVRRRWRQGLSGYSKTVTTRYVWDMPARLFAERHLGWDAFVESVAEFYDEVHASAGLASPQTCDIPTVGHRNHSRA